LRAGDFLDAGGVFEPGGGDTDTFAEMKNLTAKNAETGLFIFAASSEEEEMNMSLSRLSNE
jgi:hypothetical protein